MYGILFSLAALAMADTETATDCALYERCGPQTVDDAEITYVSARPPESGYLQSWREVIFKADESQIPIRAYIMYLGDASSDPKVGNVCRFRMKWGSIEGVIGDNPTLPEFGGWILSDLSCSTPDATPQ